ncbi:hypothetical protein C0Q70_14099 [Pomacea canaliculata]|uniref:Uncharacterized protein n=1 Tax=Pomacea canaliculata TaxID=400727 RepID=A0A2T7NZ66_POMCA|nr:hypothetical protein C0Q70_14099 [Pomacea canaliculata]
MDAGGSSAVVCSATRGDLARSEDETNADRSAHVPTNRDTTLNRLPLSILYPKNSRLIAWLTHGVRTELLLNEEVIIPQNCMQKKLGEG